MCLRSIHHPGVTQCAKECGLKPGWALDLKTKDETGNPWGFEDENQQRKAIRKIEDDRPGILILSPMCTAFSIPQNHNYDSKNTEEVKELFKRAIKHIIFTVHLCELQTESGRYFVSEHPKSAKSWQLACTKKLADMRGVIRINIDMCMFGTVSTVEDMQVAPAKKPTGCKADAEVGHMQREHVHASPIGGRAKACEIYPQDFCMQLCLGLRDQLDQDQKVRRTMFPQYFRIRLRVIWLRIG